MQTLHTSTEVFTLSGDDWHDNCLCIASDEIEHSSERSGWIGVESMPESLQHLFVSPGMTVIPKGRRLNAPSREKGAKK